MKIYDVIIIGGGAAGLSAATAASKLGKNILILDMGPQVARKVSASGGGRCNFTNIAVSAQRYFGNNPDFVRSAISRVTPPEILDWAKNHNIQYVEKTAGQYFCATGAETVVKALLQDASHATIFTETCVNTIVKQDDCFYVTTDKKNFVAKSIIIATGGTSFPALGVSDFGYKVAKQFGHKIIPIRPALCAIGTKIFSPDLSGISTDVEIQIGKEIIQDSMLFTHFGIGGPAVYRATVRNFNDIIINLLPDINVYDLFQKAKQTSGRKTVSNILADKLPLRLARWLCSDTKNIADYKDSDLKSIADKINRLVIPKEDVKLHSLQSAEVVRGGVDTSQISSKTMESKLCKGLYFAGEVLDIAGDLGGFNLHWAWASGRIAGENA